MMNRYDRVDTVRTGAVGLIVTVLVAVAAGNVATLPFLSSEREYTAQFADAGGLQVGAEVEVAGVASGRVRSIDLDGAHVEVAFTVSGNPSLGESTRASIATATVLGTRNLRLTSEGGGALRAGSEIPLARTTSPYDLSTILGDLARSTAATDTDQLADSFRALDDTLSQTPDDLRSAVDGVGRLSQTVAARDADLRSLLDRARRVTGVLAQQSEQINTLVLAADEILGELDRRRQTVETLFANVSALARSLTDLVRDNRAQLTPTLTRVNSVLGVLRDNRDNIGKALADLGPYVTELGEAVASGPFFSSYITNLIPGQIIEPFIRDAMARQGLPTPGRQGGR
ncbi:mammalian cell entry protein [Williamsia sp. Leaf354]|jgi:phospholipid/cholesterol/gamma-HCH transport system substrate-binding protein|uniref:MCE family protein n=1 Tax=Williamsia sp. Leaf354 TaxID=1736349 RepID=UPI0006F9B847|nr:MCE family protein [Williamsia sp. Leaf354]KQR98238.1 mammalian cell entry protein [Williamsia sp. Leaf354]